MQGRLLGCGLGCPVAAHRLAACLVLTACLPACLTDGQGPGPLVGPSTLALSIRLSATPDVLPTDGAARAVVVVSASGPDGEPAGNLQLAVRIVESSTMRDAGQLSTRLVVTDAAGRAAFSYRAPPAAGNSAGDVDRGRAVTLVVTPVTGDFANAVGRHVRIRLVPAGTVIPPFDVQPGFVVTPPAPVVFDQVRFSATACPAADSAPAGCTRDRLGLIAAYRWDFGDGGRAAGQQLAHVYSKAGTYLVRLTVTDAFNRSADATRTLTVVAGTPPAALFAVSPTPATAGAQVFFDASASTAAAGRRLVAYKWNFGDGGAGSGVATNHVYAAAGTYTAILNVTDDRGGVGSAAGAVEIGGAAPTAVMTVSPPAPNAGQSVFFSAEQSTAVPGRRIVQYQWRFGDGRESADGPTTRHAYAESGDYLVDLSVTDDRARTGRTRTRVSVE